MNTPQRHATQAGFSIPSNRLARSAVVDPGSSDPGRSLEPGQAAVAEAGIGQVGFGLLPAGLGVVIVEPDAIDRRGTEGLPEGVHPLAAVARMRRADTLPAVGRGRDPAVGPDRPGVGVVFQIARTRASC